MFAKGAQVTYHPECWIGRPSDSPVGTVFESNEDETVVTWGDEDDSWSTVPNEDLAPYGG